MIGNSDKFQLILLQNSTKKVIREKFKADNNEIESADSVIILGITIDNQLLFDDHISRLCNKASMQLNAIFRLLKKYMSQKESEVVLDSFYVFQFQLLPPFVAL